MCQSTSDNIRLWIIVIITTCDNHYYDETDIVVGKPIEGKVVINHHVELTEEEKAQARKDAMKRIENEAYAQMKQPKKPTKPVETQPQASLFDF